MSLSSFQGYTFDSRTVAGLIEVDRETIVPFRITQGSYSTKVGASAGTHAKGGTGDCSTRFMTQTMKNTLVKTLRRNGFAAWIRPKNSSWSEHIHFVMIQPGGRNDQGVLSDAAWKQVKEYYDGYDGLAGDGKDPHAWIDIEPVTFEAQHAKSSFPLGIGSTFSTTTHNGRASAGEALHVKKIQKRLSVSTTGYYGIITTTKVRAWQTWKGIKPTGAVGKVTWDRLFPPS